MTRPSPQAIVHSFVSTRKIVHISMLIFALLFPFLSWMQAAGCALLALLFNVFILPQLDVDLGKARGDSPTSDTRAPTETWIGIVIYPVSVLLLILFYRHHLYIAAAVWAVMALGDGVAGIMGAGLRGPPLPWNPEKTWSGFCSFIIAATLGAYAFTLWVAPSLQAGRVLAVCTATAVVGALVESLPIRLDDNVSVPLVCGAFMYCVYLIDRTALAGNWPYLPKRLALAVVVNLAFALLALALGWANRSGAAMGFLLGAAIYLAYGYKSFLILLAFIFIGSLVTRVGYAKKAARGVAERRGGARSWREALANMLTPAFFAVLAVTTLRQSAFLLAVVAALAEATGDTVSSEIGQVASSRAYLVTSFRRVPPGENGGISIAGTATGFAASALVVGIAYATGLCGPRPLPGAAIALAAAMAGNVLDSLLGATLERRGLLTNGLVNFAGTSFAGAFAFVLATHLHVS